MYFSPGLGTVGVGRVCDPIDKGGGACAAPVEGPYPPAAVSHRDMMGTGPHFQLERINRKHKQNTTQCQYAT